MSLESLSVVQKLYCAGVVVDVLRERELSDGKSHTRPLRSLSKKQIGHMSYVVSYITYEDLDSAELSHGNRTGGLKQRGGLPLFGSPMRKETRCGVSHGFTDKNSKFWLTYGSEVEEAMLMLEVTCKK